MQISTGLPYFLTYYIILCTLWHFTSLSTTYLDLVITFHILFPPVWVLTLCRIMAGVVFFWW